MRIVVIGGTGRIGQHMVQKLTLASHEAISLDVVSAARSTGVDLISGDGLAQMLDGAEVVVNLTNSPTFDEMSLDFFRTSMNNLLAAGASAGVGHQVVLSMVGVDRVPQLDYFRAKTMQEELLRQGPTPYSIVRATQFFEFMDTIISWDSDDTAVRLPSACPPPRSSRSPPQTSSTRSSRFPSATRCGASVTSPARTSFASTNWAGSRWPRVATADG